MGELVFLGCVAFVCVAMLTMTGDFPSSIIDNSGGPAMFPRIVIAGLLVVMIVRAVTILRSRELFAAKFVFLDIFRGNSLVYLILFVGYALAMPHLGFAVGTSAFLVASMLFLYAKQYAKMPGLRTAAMLVVCSVLGTLAVRYAFSTLLNVVLPTGFFGS